MRGPYVDVDVLGTSRSPYVAERRKWRPALVETSIHSSDRYGGAAACRHLWTMVHSLYITRCRIGSQCKSSRSVAVMSS